MAAQYKEWSVANNLDLFKITYGGHSYPVLAELKNSGYHSISNISLEFFNHELQKVDTSNTHSIKAFSEQFGFIFSPLYPSKVLALRSRNQNEAWTEVLAGFAPSIDGNDDPHTVIDMSISSFENPLGGNKSVVDRRSAGKVNSFYLAPTIYANDIYRRDSRYGAIVSVSELALTIRYLQTLMPLIAAYEAGLKDDDMVEYLFRSPALRHDLPQGFAKDMFYGLVFDSIPKTSLEVIADKQSREIDNDYLTKLHRIYLNMQFDELYAAGDAFIRKAKLALSLQNEGIPMAASALQPDHFTKDFAPITEGSLLEAILANFETVRTSKQDWHRCKYDRCGRVFKFHKEYDPTKRFRQADFCKKSCRVMAIAK